jgi:glycosyltransferase involved in cell wall biosynthesis
MKILVVSDFSPDADSGAGGSILAINRALKSLGHEVFEAWHPREVNQSRVQEELVGKASRLHKQAEQLLSEHPDANVLVISQPYAYRAFEKLRRQFPHLLLVNRTHGWEARGIEIQNRFAWDKPRGMRRLLRPISQAWMQRMCRRVVRASDFVVTASSSDETWIRQKYALSASHVVNIPYGLDLGMLPPPPTANSPRANNFVYAGNFLDRKGAGVLKRILPQIGREFPKTRLEMYVDRFAIDSLEGCLRRDWGDRLQLSTWVERSKLLESFTRTQFMLLPSYFEGFGKTTVETLAMGCLILGFREGHLSNLDETVSRCVDIGDEAGFRDLVRAAAAGNLAFDGDASTKAIKIGRARSWNDVAGEFVEVCERTRRNQSMPGISARFK